MISVDAVTGEIFLQLQPKSKIEDVAQYLADLCKDACRENIDKISIVLDNNPPHKLKMKTLLNEHLQSSGLEDKIVIEFIHTPAYSRERFFSGEIKDPKCGKMALCLTLSK